MSPSPDRDQKERRRIQGPRRRSRSPDFHAPLESETRRQRSRSPRRRSRSPDFQRSNKSETRLKTPFVKQYSLRRRCERVHIDERLVIDLVTPEPEIIPTIENAVIEDINATNNPHPHPFQTYRDPVDLSSSSTPDPIFTPHPLPISRQPSTHRNGEGIHDAANIPHSFQTYREPVDPSSTSTPDPIFIPHPLPISREPSTHRDGEGIHGIAAAFRGPVSQRADRIRATFADAFGGSQKPDLASQIPSRPHSHPPSGLPPHPVAFSFKEVYDSVFGGPQKAEPPSHPLPHRVVGPLKSTGSDAILVPNPSQPVLATNPEPFSGRVVNNLDRTTAKKLASDMLKMPLYKDGVYYYIFWTDGSFQRVGALNKGGAAAVWFDPTRDEWYSWREKAPYGDTTSNDAELLGIGIALRTASSFIARFQENHPFIPVARHEVFVFTDSSACLQLIPRAHFYPLCKQWARQSLLGDILEASASLKRLGANIQLHWVPSHSGVIGNEVADREARYAAHGEFVGQQASSGPWERPSAVTASGLTMTTINHAARSIARKHRNMVNRFNSILHPQGSKDYISLL
ncbi:uncharacterized protein N7503_011671 [Penicillium pulvis]|uniref:uncharacterized protein n=1 Tax=Penicillium pulvis TaxID=1562058 RepID=UPI00254797F2|nr:uncharacterized protein N7503_011671 [Penicillium pulvis]KAJ5786459.1 hypothetical protein N7503_011671 [Penicillium pulvis]